MAGVSWYAFNFNDYASDTARLSCEAHGAYIQLIADYYNTKEPLPDDDFILAAVTKLPIEQWQKHRKVIARYFTIADGVWRHERIDHEIRQASEKHAASIAAAKVAATARWANKGDKPDQSTAATHRNTSKQRKNATRIASALPDAQEPQSESHADLQIHSPITGEREGPLPEVDDDDLELGTTIPRDFLPSAETSDRARAAGMEVAEIDAEVRKFINHQLAAGNFSSNWQASFSNWIDRGIEYRKKQAAKAPPRIEVNNAAPYVPTEKDWDDACMRYARNNSIWSKHLGPDPGLPSCRAPITVLLKHGLRKAAS